jgi:hypothetical protein
MMVVRADTHDGGSNTNYVFSAVLNSTARPVKIMVVHQDSKRGAKYKSHLFISLLHEI